MTLSLVEGMTERLVQSLQTGDVDVAVVSAFPTQTLGGVELDLTEELLLLRAGALERNGITILAAVLAEEHANPELLRVFRKHVIRPRRENIRRILNAGKASGQLDADADIELGISMLVGALYAAYRAGRRPGREWPSKVVDAWLRANGAPEA